jgi:hypothetical protein
MRMRATPWKVRAGIVLTAALAVAGCSQLGYSDRVLVRLPSPDGNIVFVCQETPELDGPGHEWRLERRDGAVLRHLFRGSDGNGVCDEARWSTDGGTLAVVSRDTVHIADVEWTLAHPDLQKTHWFVRQFSFPDAVDGMPRLVRDIRFVAPGELAFNRCTESQESVGGTDVRRCLTERLRIPSPLVPDRAS